LHEIAGALNTMHGQQCVVVSTDRAAFNQGRNAQYQPGYDETGTAFTVVAKDPGAVAVDCRNIATGGIYPTLQAKSNGGTSLNYTHAIIVGYLVRRLLPVETERLQGFPDNWTDVAGASDSARYRMCGNSIALPQWEWMLGRIKDSYYERL
jgi:DNA (cytosine-5)-methyltransferase 1